MKDRALALDRDPSGRFLPWIVAALSLVVAVAVGVSFSLAELTASWGVIGNDRLIVRYAAEDGDAARAAASGLAAEPRVAQARLLPRDEVRALLEPWLGGATASETELPLPWLIDVQLADPAAEREVRRALEAWPGATVDSTRGWLEPLQRLAGLAGIVAMGLALLSVSVIVLVTVFAIRAALSAQSATVELLRQMGAEERYIARRFQRHGFRQAITGGIAGVAPGAVIVGLGVGAARLEGAELIAGLNPGWTGWLCIGLLPALIALVATLTARYTVLEMLRNRW
ncbi:MAG: cell division protein FtsX [Minwuia sp.]|uniref:cell division protein FtsX n=1 Tax=Minwuia sp. TaxID=2493630 RepID=UPI003A85C184